jgi:hypothetical protein
MFAKLRFLDECSSREADVKALTLTGIDMYKIISQIEMFDVF